VAAVFSGVGGTAVTLVLTVASALTAGVGWVSIVTFLAEESPAGAATTMALNGALFNLGAAAGGALGGLVLAAWGFPVAGLAFGVTATCAALLVAVQSRSLLARFGTIRYVD
jgi:predicted MFS family arabinose efflux permease